MRATLMLCIAGLSTTLVGANDVILVAGPVEGPIPFIGNHPAVVATDDGFAVAWNDIVLTAPFITSGKLRLARYDAAGHRTADSGRTSVDADVSSEIRLVPSRDGFAYFIGYDAYEVQSGSFGPDGTLLRTPQSIVESIELYPYDVAPGPGGDMVLTYPEWIGTWTIWSVPLGAGALPSGPRVNVVPATSGQDLDYRFIDVAPIVSVGTGFAVAWMEGRVGARTRELDTHGVPSGPVTLVAGMGSCPAAAAIAAVGSVEAIIYSAGCTQTDLYLAKRPRGGALSAATQLTFEPVDEGSSWYGDLSVPLRAVGGSQTFMVFYSIVVPYGVGGFSTDYALAEFDLAGHSVGSPTVLGRDLGIYANTAVDLAWDGKRNRFLVAWDGDGPQGPGVYVMGIPSGRF